MAVGLTGQIFEEDYLQQFKQAVCKEMRQKCVPVWQDEQAKMIREKWYNASGKKNHKIVVIDDDPTGTQTVHDVPVYTAYDLDHIKKGFEEACDLFYILTNSRSLKQEETEKLHCQLGKDIAQAAKESGKTCTVISRGDSTLRGHYPMETECLKQAMEKISGEKIHGEIVAPFFLEGGRITMGDVHYVVQKDGEMIPAGETEFAKDKTFSYCASNLREWIEEKTAGKVKAEDVLSFSLEDLRNSRPEEIADRLETVNDFGKVIVNAVCYEDMIAFALGYEMALERGKRFMFRSAAAVPKVLGRITDQPLLTRKDMIREETKAGGLIIAGSHVKKTTDQLNSLLSDPKRMTVEFNQHLILDHMKMEKEFERVIGLVNWYINEGHTTVVYTRRKRLATRVTSHIPVSEISTNLTVENILESIQLADTTLKQAGYENPLIGVAALNPHGGEGGLCGQEELTVIGPAVEKAKKEGINVKGPFPADTLFKQAFDGRFHAVVTMYHDQGQIALKLKGFERGITIGGGLRLPATTCAHGTAHDIAWKGIASVQSLENAYRMVCRMAENG